MKTTATILSGLVAACALYAIPVDAQVVRESDVKSITGSLDGMKPTASWTFKSAGNEVLFASLSADVYRQMPGGDDGHVSSAAEPDGGCDEDEGGPVRFYLEVQDVSGATVCRAERPAPPPGWQRDPRLACKLPATGGAQLAYSLIVGMTRMGGEEPHATSVGGGDGHPFVLDVSLRRIAPTGTTIQSAIAQSKNAL